MTDRYPRTAAQVNKALADLHLRLIKAPEGYCYFVPTTEGHVCFWAQSTSVPTPRISDLTLAGWRWEAERIIDEGKRNSPYTDRD